MFVFDNSAQRAISPLSRTKQLYIYIYIRGLFYKEVICKVKLVITLYSKFQTAH